jgi:hypothetical protein
MATTETTTEKKPRKPAVRKPLYVLIPTGDDERAPYTVVIVKTLGEVRKAIEDAKVDGSTPTAMARVIVLRAQKLPMKLSTQVTIKF